MYSRKGMEPVQASLRANTYMRSMSAKLFLLFLVFPEPRAVAKQGAPICLPPYSSLAPAKTAGAFLTSHKDFWHTQTYLVRILNATVKHQSLWLTS